MQRLLGPRRQLRRDLLLRAPQDERPQRRATARRASPRSASRRARRAAANADAAPSRPGLRNSNRLHSSPRWFSTGVPLSASRCVARSSRAAFADAVARVLDRLRLVEDRVVELDVLRAAPRRGAACRRSSARCRARATRRERRALGAACSRARAASARTARPPAAS